MATYTTWGSIYPVSWFGYSDINGFGSVYSDYNENLINDFVERVILDGGIVDTVAHLNNEESTATLIMNPSAYKSGVLYALKPEDGSGDFTFSRGSIATRVNKDGLIETMGNNIPRITYEGAIPSLLLELESTNLVLSSASGNYGNGPESEINTISPDGTNNAIIPVPNESSDRYQEDISGGTYATDTKLAYSWYRKRISTPVDATYVGDLRFNALVNVTQVGSTTQIESDVNGFDRFQGIFNITDGSASTIIRLYFGGAVGNGNSSVAYWGHQLEVGDSSTSYIPTSGSAVTRLEDVATIDLTPFTLTSITETIGGVVQTPITVIPTTYSISKGDIQLIEMN